MEDITMALSGLPTGFPGLTSRQASLLDRFFEDNLMDWTNSNYSTTNTTLPKVNIKENDNEFLIEVAAPGMKKNDFNIHYDNGKLSVSSEVEEKLKDGEKYTRREFSYQSFKRTFDVSRDIVDGDKINAKYQDGILLIVLPKHEEIKPRPVKEIAIT
jgi:HSP20 family protein